MIGWKNTFWLISALAAVGALIFYAMVKEAPPLEEEKHVVRHSEELQKNIAVAATAGVDRSRAPINPMITGFLSLIVFLLWMGLANANSWGEKGLLPQRRQKVISEC